MKYNSYAFELHVVELYRSVVNIKISQLRILMTEVLLMRVTQSQEVENILEKLDKMFNNYLDLFEKDVYNITTISIMDGYIAGVESQAKNIEKLVTNNGSPIISIYPDKTKVMSEFAFNIDEKKQNSEQKPKQSIIMNDEPKKIIKTQLVGV